MAEEILVKFYPEGKRASIERGKTILDAALKADVDLAALCGGKGFCGKCQVVVVEGSENLSPLTEVERKHLSAEKLELGFRLACQAKVYGDVAVKIPEYSRTGKQKLVIMGVEPPRPLKPAVRKIYVELPPPTLEDPLADDLRLINALREKGFEVEEIDPEILVKLPDLLREAGWKITATIIDGKKIIDVEPRDVSEHCYGIAVDIGTTKLACFLVNLNTGELLHACGTMNPQIPYGEDVMSRISYAMEGEDHLQQLKKAVVDGINGLIQEALTITGVRREHLYELVAVGNTAMHHLFIGIQPAYVGRSPYPPAVAKSCALPPQAVGIAINNRGRVHVLPNIAGFVGADAVACLLATEVHKSAELKLLMDVGTNTEVSLGNREKILSCSTASGPAFEGAHIKYGMRAATGAIERVKIDEETFEPEISTIDDAKPRGICGSGIIDVIAEMLRVGLLDTRGRIQRKETTRIREGPQGLEYVLAWKEETPSKAEDLVITQKDIREIQLAKAAMRTGCEILMKRLGIGREQISELIIAGAFGSYINPESARILGMIPEVPLERIKFVGNTAGSGARMCLKSVDARREAEEIARRVEYVELAALPEFQEEYVNAMAFPHADISKHPEVMSKIKAPVTTRIYREST
ncbi:MAG: DUF4445 domain-containing protein [Candidatus Verstraetearchaeota archaeon]|nr:DUF4445 domain-containing protein [Candidatus Verstraetearchaeota archaeon]